MRRGIQGRLLAECNDPKAQDDKVFKMTPKSCDSCAPSWPLDNHRHSTACQHDAIISFLYSWQTHLQSYHTCTAGRHTCNHIVLVQLADTPAIISYLYSWPTHLQSYRTCTAGRLTWCQVYRQSRTCLVRPHASSMACTCQHVNNNITSTIWLQLLHCYDKIITHLS